MDKKKTVKDKTVKDKKPKESKFKKIFEPKPRADKSKGYVMKKNAGMKILRIVLWVILVFIFLRGIASIFQRSNEEVVTQMINDFYANYSDFTYENEEVMSFAENFVREYLTYTVKGEEDYISRLENYVAGNFFNSNVLDFRAAATVVYVNAYRADEYSANQKDVYVLAEVEYERNGARKDTKQITLKVPLYCAENSFVVECIPQIVSDSMYIEKYMPVAYYGTSMSEEEVFKIKTSTENFLKAYLEADASVVDYYLADTAVKEDFEGLGGSFTLQGIESIQCFRGEENGIICLVEYNVKDSENGAIMLQKINLTMNEAGGKYFIVSMAPRVGNLNIK